MRWRLDAVKVGDLLHTPPDKDKPETGRPYHILYLTDMKAHSTNDSKYVVINIHNGHQGGAKRLIRNLSTNPDHALITTGGKELDRQKEHAIYQKVIKGNKFRIIMLGDFNDGNKDQYYKGLRPFAASGISELKELRVSSHGITPPRTCCTPSDGSSDIRSGVGEQAKREYNGDYILIGDGLEYVEPTHVPSGPGLQYDARKYPASDHLPVMAVIRPRAVK